MIWKIEPETRHEAPYVVQIQLNLPLSVRFCWGMKKLSMLVDEPVGNLVCTELSTRYPFRQNDPNRMIKQAEVRPRYEEVPS
jgi:hypothetical protein